MKFPRSSGILLHPTSLPAADGRFGIGDLGPEAFRFVDFLASAGQTLWQVMPLGPTGYGDSPYACFSAFAGNPLLVSPEFLMTEGLLSPHDLKDIPAFPTDRVDYGPVIQWKTALLHKVWAAFRNGAAPKLHAAFDAFCRDNVSWLDDFSLFIALKHVHQAAWPHWPRPLATRDAEALYQAESEHRDHVMACRFHQFLFFSQWSALKHYANRKGIRIIGDIPIFVAYDSADAWAHRELFHFDPEGRPTIVAGVPPDYFSATGQLWGNPMYRWDVMKESGFRWWVDRFRANLVLVDIIRLDHFRGFEACWEVPASETTAINGKWVPAPGYDLFQTLRGMVGDIPIIAEDLGVITPPVRALRDAFGFPGMKVLQFAFGGDPASEYLPHNFSPNSVVYTGTHDNDTTAGWHHATSTENERDLVRRYIGTDGREIHWDFIKAALFSVSHTAIIPIQDVLGLGSEGRMNYPGRPSGNWTWRLWPGWQNEGMRARLAELTWLSGRSAPAAQ